MTTTMVETFDAQMLDYQNDDYSMHVSSSDTWFHDEAIMEDEGLPIDGGNVSIEVDMEPYDEDHNTEYEMVDGSENYDLSSTEVFDVEVYDASRATTPTPVPAIVPPTLPPTDIGHSSHSAPEFTESSESVSVINPSPPPPTTELPETSADNDDVKTLIHEVAASSDSPYLQTGENLTDTPTIDSPDNLAEKTLSSTNAEPDLDNSLFVESSEATVIVAEQDVISRDQIASLDDQGSESGIAAQPDHLDQSGSITTSNAHQLHFHEDGQGTGEHANYDSTASSGDPHEISEGVFIDPPPAVLLSVSLDDPFEISLFNAPTQFEATSSTPKDQSHVPILLAQFPILYYEPLSSVFEALRQDEFFANRSEIMNVELALDAYDLELVLSEDNVHGHEVSLHDLNVLHDGLNYPGPLRLRLETAGSRFIVRYQMLQDHVARLNISESKDDGPESSGDIPQVKHADTQDSKDEGLKSEEYEANQITSKPTKEQLQEIDNDETLRGTDVESYHAVTTTYEQEYHSETIKDFDLPQDSGIDEPDHTDVDQQDEPNEDSLDSVGHENEFATPIGEANTGHDGDPETHVEENRDEESTFDEETEETFEGVPPDGLQHTEDANANLTEAPNHTPRIGEISRSPPNNAGIDEDQQSHSYLDRESSLGEPDLDRHKVELLTANPLVPDSNVEHDIHDKENEVELAKNKDFPATDDPEDENKELNTETGDDDLDGEGDPDLLWEHEQETASNQSSVTLSSKTSSKRSISEAELGDNDDSSGSPPFSPGLKRTRVQ